MRALSTAELMAVWEFAVGQPAAHRALTFLAAAAPDEAAARETAQLSLGESDALLLAWREVIFGPQLPALASCPACAEKLELSLETAALRIAPEMPPEQVFGLSLGEWQVRFRLPTNLDIASLELEADDETRRRQLLACCVIEAHRPGAPVAPEALPPEVVAAIAARMAEADPQAELQLTLTCPECAHQWASALDVVSFLWSEINAWAVRILNEVHILASAYGWREADILALSLARRAAYLDLA